MKRLFYIFLMLGLMVVFLSCSDDEETLPIIAVYSNHLGFGEVIVGETSSPQSIEIKNLSSDKILIIDGLTLDDTENYELFYTGTLPFHLEGGESKQISITFMPKSSGNLDSALRIDSNASNLSSKAVAVSLDGSGIMLPITLDVSPDSLDFGIVGVNFFSETQTLLLDNISDQIVQVNQLSIDPVGNFSFNVDAFPFEIPIGGQKEIDMIFSPGDVGSFNATLTIHSEESRSISAVLKGEGLARIDRLFQWMTGSFSSEAQADTSSDPYHYAIGLKMVRIWDNLDDYWMYVEQAEIGESPYRQRIYRVFQEEGQLQDEIYRMDDPGQYFGNWTWDNTSIFDNLTPDDLELAQDCNVYFQVANRDHFYGSTDSTGCLSSIPGVEYITSETTIFGNYLTSWDLGYDAGGNVVMGPYSPYLFDKLEDWPPYAQ